MRRRKINKGRLITGAAIASVITAILAYAAYKSHRDEELSVEAIKSTLKKVAKDIELPQPVAAADVNKFFAEQGQKISEITRKEREFLADVLEDTAKKINKNA
jgi:hypothetical protein